MIYVEPVPFNPQNLDIGSSPDEALDVVTKLLDNTDLATHHRNADLTALPCIEMGDLGHAHVKAVPQAVDDGLN